MTTPLRKTRSIWPEDVVKLGFTQLPHILLRGLGKLAVKPSSVLVLLNLLSRIQPGRLTAWPSIATIADETGLSRATVKRSLQGLLNAELLTVVEGNRPSTTYDLSPFITAVVRMATPALPEHDEAEDHASGANPDSAENVSPETITAEWVKKKHPNLREMVQNFARANEPPDEVQAYELAAELLRTRRVPLKMSWALPIEVARALYGDDAVA